LLLHGFLGLVALLGRVVHALALLAIENGTHCLLFGRETGDDIEQLIGVDRRPPFELVHEVGRALKEGMYDLRLSDAPKLGTALGKVSYEVPEQLVGLLGAD
jgi:hypothetical protein